MKEIKIPDKLLPLIKAFSADEKSARLLIIEASKAICNSQQHIIYSCDDREISNEEIEGIISLMKGIDPRDTIELIYGAQIVSSHLMGLRMLSHPHKQDQTLGLNLLRFSNEALERLQKKRSGGSCQNINITYNHLGSGILQSKTGG